MPGEHWPIAANAAAFLASAVAVWLAGTRIARDADAIAVRTGIGHAAIGMLLLGGVTSTPEIAVGIGAGLTGHAALSVNNVLGAGAFNVTLLAIADALFGREALTIMLASPAVLLQGLLSVLLFAVVVADVVGGAGASVAGVGVGSLVIVAVYAFAVRIVVKSKGRKSWVPAVAPPEEASPGSGGDGAPLRVLVTRTAVAAVIVFAAGFMLSQSGAALAVQTGLGTNFFGAVLLAFATALPEMSTVFESVRLRRHEMAIADIFGTNMFNMLIIVLVDVLDRGAGVLAGTGRFAAFAALLAIVLTSILLIGMVERRDKTVLRMGLDSLAILVCYLIGLALLYRLR